MQSNRSPVLVCFAAVLLGIVTAAAPAQTTYEVSNASELNQAVSVLQAGDTVLLAPGDYNAYLRLTGVSGTSTAWITFRSSSGRARLIPSAWQDVIRLADCNYIRFEDLELTTANAGASINGVLFPNNTNSSHITFDNCYIHDVSANGIKSYCPVLESLTVINCEFANCNICGIFLGWPNPLQQARNTVIKNCYIHDCSDGVTGYGIQIKAGSYGARIENNVLHDTSASSRAAIAVYYADANGNLPASQWNVIRNNFIFSEPNEGIYAVNSALIENNIIVDVKTAINVSSNGGNVIDNLQIRHNTIYRSSARGIYLNELSSAKPSVVVANNAVFVTDSGAFSYRAPQGLGSTGFYNNGYYGPVYNITSGLVALASPATEFVDAAGVPTSLDLYPRAGSNLIGSALGSLAPRGDFNGEKRPGTTLGAYGYVGSTNPGWTLAKALKPPVEGFTRARYEISGATGGFVFMKAKNLAPAGFIYFVQMSALGPDPVGNFLPLHLDGFSTLPFFQQTGFLFRGYLGPTNGGTGEYSMRHQVVPQQLTRPLVLYHSMGVLKGAGPENTDVVRLVITP